VTALKARQWQTNRRQEEQLDFPLNSRKG